MNFKNVNVSMDSCNHMWIDIKVDDINAIHRATTLGGNISVYELHDNYYMSFCHQAERSFINFYGLEITKDQFEFHRRSWGDSHCEIVEGTELLLADDLYFETRQFENSFGDEGLRKDQSLPCKKELLRNRVAPIKTMPERRRLACGK